MKYCPKDKSHKNPAEAVFCCECGSRLVEVADNKICPKCSFPNPIEAIYCRECGTKLPDANGNVELTVYSSEICDRILAVETNSYQTNTSKCVLKVPSKKSVDILLQCGGKPFRITTDLTKSNILNVNWGTIEIRCTDSCQVRMTGRNMDTPLIRQNVSMDIVKVPYGVYILRFELDGETEEMTVDVHGKTKVESHLQRKYKLIINSDVKIDRLTIDNGNAIVVKSNKFLWRNPQGTYTFRIYATSINGSGSYETTINLNKDSMLELKWCHINVKTNGQATAIFRQDAASSQTRITHNGSFSLLAVRGIKNELQLTKPHGGIHKEIITPNIEKLEIVRDWGDVSLVFDRSEYKGIKCNYNVHVRNCFAFDECRPNEAPYFASPLPREEVDIHGTIPQNNHDLLLKDLLCGYYSVNYGIGNEDYQRDTRNFIVEKKDVKQIRCNIPLTLTKKAKWQWLRRTVYYVLYVIDILLLMAVPLRFLFSFIYSLNHLEKNLLNIVPILALLISQSAVPICFAYENFYVKKRLYDFIVMGEKIIQRINGFFKVFSLMFLGLAIFSELLQIGVHLYKKHSNGIHISFLEPYDINFWSLPLIKSNYAQELLLIAFYYLIIWGITYIVFRLKIKGYSINDTLYYRY